MQPPLLALLAAQRAAELERQRLIAASGAKGSVAARARMKALREEQLREETR